jgi:hypothetical protein
MRITQAIPLLAFCAFSVPALSQDFLQPLQDMVDELTAPAQSPRPRETAAEPETNGMVPVPRPRPPSLPDVPVVDAPPTPLAPAAGPAAPEQAEEPDLPPPEQSEPEQEPAQEPATEPQRVYQVACPAVINGLLKAEMAPPLNEGTCEEKSPLTITGVMSQGRMVPLSSPITTNCQLATQLPGWVEDVDGYAQSMLESPLASITTGTSYMCRGRNSSESQFTSEHGFANAVDVVGFTLEDGRSISVTENWMPAEAGEGRLLRLAHDAACGSFMTVLGPEANAEHQDHLHLDMGCHGKSCEARICQ